jgi:hypothetical protein
MIVIGLKGLIGAARPPWPASKATGLYAAGSLARWSDMLRAYPHYRRCDEATIERMIDGDLKEQPLP